MSTGTRRPGDLPRHRADVRPRWGRICATLLSTVVVVVALLGAVGLLHDRDQRAFDPSAHVADAAGAAGQETADQPADEPSPSGGAATPQPSTDGDDTAQDPTSRSGSRKRDHDTGLPPDSGAGRRAVFSQSRQRVWLVDADGTVQRTYLVSGSVTDNLQPGTYSVYSRSEEAVGVDESGTMRWFVRFAHGPNAAIGFHDIPVKAGKPLQTRRQLGTPQSHGCIRQKESDALAMWDFAQIGTPVVVTA